MKSNYLLIMLAFILGSCANQVKNEDRLEQEYKFGSVMYIEYKKSEDSGNKDVFGKIIFNKNSIKVEMNIDGQVENEDFTIRTVTFDKSPNELKYRTYKGDFSVKLRNDTIIDVTLYTGSFLTTFNKTKEIALIKNKLPISIGMPLKDWKRIEISDIGTIDLSPKLEIQSGKYKEMKLQIKDKAQEIWGLKFDEPKLVIQPKGINQFDETSLSKYCRVIIETIPGNPDEFQRLNEKIDITSSELSELNIEFKNQVQQGFYNTPLKLIEWYPLRINEINGMPCIHASYKRQFKDQPFVIVDLYRFLNYDRIISLTISYRISEKEYWSSILNNTLKSFRITNIK
ncbi:hypothetical protein SAMN05444280_103186 [Tangfeifania diversioriginum]|uniref:Uncharacterized protein n=1 Tax=Tangfeifania diversioriginum TaxID=1168035 RepID=A0A1M6C9L3_9BACT|nr:hypothetical protein [Tangfeifania diversioriginum]SHI57686.1 hypothetical protein SAMN05444280_103186 [Tangfeifania diversioriginum]